jgi:hypothetical protein
MHYYQKIMSPWKRVNSSSKTVDTSQYSDEYGPVLTNILWKASEKVDGTNVNFFYDGNHVSYKGHTDKTSFPAWMKEYLDSIATKEFEQLLEQWFGDKEFILHCELVGPKIQSNPYSLEENRIYLFDIYNKTNNSFWPQESLYSVAIDAGFYVPEQLGTATLNFWKNKIMSGELASHINPAVEIEGLVIRPVLELKKNNGDRLIYKIKVKDLLGRAPRKDL